MFQLNPITKAIFGVASVTFEVRAITVVSDAEVTFDHSALEGTKQIRPDSARRSRSVGADFAFGGQGCR